MGRENGHSNAVSNGDGLENGYSNGVTRGGEKKGKKAHVLFVTIAFPGHFAPKVQLLYHLEAKYPGLAVTVWANKDRIADLEKLQLKGDLKGFDLRMEEAFGEVPVYAADPKFPVRAATTSAKCFEDCKSFREKLVAQKDAPGGPTAIVADMFQQWSKDLADELGVPWYTYFSISPLFLPCLVHRSALIEAGLSRPTSSNSNERLESTCTGFPSILVRDLPEEVFIFEEFYNEMIDRTKRASAIVLNASEELDAPGGSIVAVRELWPSTRILPVGPSLQYPGFGKVYTSTVTSSNCLQWLDTQAKNTVLYVAFGSLGAIPTEFVTELAAGLEASGVPFLWALRVPATQVLSEWLPEGFLERTKGRGIVETGWAPQVRILAHPSTGGFLSHSGWNSTLESFCAGVPLISWPLSAEQHMNARFIADVAKVGLAICYLKDRDQDSFDDITRHTVTKAVKQLMLEKNGERLRANSAEVQKSLLAAVVEGGSSYKNLHLLLNELGSGR